MFVHDGNVCADDGNPNTHKEATMAKTKPCRPRYWPILDIPEARIGEYKIRHLHFPTGQVFNTSTARTQIIGGQGGSPVSFNKPVRFHELSYKSGVWMTDVPIEQAQADPVFKDYHGSVLVGGLGLGYAVTRIARKRNVERVVVVEIAPEVINLVAPHLNNRLLFSKIEVVQDDLHSYLRNTTEQFDFAFYDIWQSDGEDTFFHTVVPLLRDSLAVVVRRPDCWNENVMRGQLLFSLHSRLTMLEPAMQHWSGNLSLKELCTLQDSIWTDWSVPFFCWYRDHALSKAHAEIALHTYVNNYGLPGFEAWWPPEFDEPQRID